jgi:Ser/Thr protein kinase RdoA (MazF antagonist)
MRREKDRAMTPDENGRVNRQEWQTTPFPVLHSILSPEALMATVAADYALGTPVACTVLRANRNDTYLLKTTHDRFILRVYGTSWRSRSHICSELDLLLHLDKKGVSVSTPIARKDGLLIRDLFAPEGPRHLVVFTHAPGIPLYGERIEAHSRLLGSNWQHSIWQWTTFPVPLPSSVMISPISLIDRLN